MIGVGCPVLALEAVIVASVIAVPVAVTNPVADRTGRPPSPLIGSGKTKYKLDRKGCKQSFHADRSARR
jgi:hypothetical protein